VTPSRTDLRRNYPQTVIARSRRRRSNLHRGKAPAPRDCFASLAMTVWNRRFHASRVGEAGGRLARNKTVRDGTQYCTLPRRKPGSTCRGGDVGPGFPHGSRPWAKGPRDSAQPVFHPEGSAPVGVELAMIAFDQSIFFLVRHRRCRPAGHETANRPLWELGHESREPLLHDEARQTCGIGD
jgi:hypothetical protein